jgi:predicted HicB family RNase H-like nuclease
LSLSRVEPVASGSRDYNPFGDPPEAEEEVEQSSTVYVRVPPALKRTIDHAAGTAKLSANAWAMKCMEWCLSDSEERAFSLAWHFAKSL